MSSVFLSLEEEKRERKMGTRRGKSPVNAVLIWLMRQPMKVKSCLAVVFTVCSLVAMKLFVKNHDYFFVASEAIHAAGIMVLIYKLTTKNSCSGIIYIYQHILPFNSFFFFSFYVYNYLKFWSPPPFFFPWNWLFLILA